MWNVHNTVFGSKRSAICALVVYFAHLTWPKIQCLVSCDSIVDRHFVTTCVREWVTNIRFMCRAVPSTVVRSCRKFGEDFLSGVYRQGMTLNWFQRWKWKLDNNHCGVMATWSRMMLKKFIFLSFCRRTTIYGKIFKILFRTDLSRHLSSCCVQISWNLNTGNR